MPNEVVVLCLPEYPDKPVVTVRKGRTTASIEIDSEQLPLCAKEKLARFADYGKKLLEVAKPELTQRCRFVITPSYSFIAGVPVDCADKLGIRLTGFVQRCVSQNRRALHPVRP